MRYRKIDPRFWKDEKVRRLEFTDKLIALYIFTGQSNRIGIFTFSVGMGAEDTNLPVETFVQRCRNVCQALNWVWDEQAGVMYLPTWWKYDQPPNPNNVVGCLTDLADVPNSPLVARFCANVEHLKTNLAETFTQTLAEHYQKRMGTPEPLPLPLPEPPFIPPQAGGHAPTAMTSPNGHHQRGRGRATADLKAKAAELLAWLNEKAGSDFRPFETDGRPTKNLELIIARLRSGIEGFKLRLMISRQVEAWKGDPEMEQYLRPATLFNRTKCEQYVGQLKTGRAGESDPYAKFPR